MPEGTTPTPGKAHDASPHQKPIAPRHMRIEAFDVLRGISIILMLWAHCQHLWLRPEDLWLISITFIILNVHGTPGFTFVSGLGFGFSWEQKRRQGKAQREMELQALTRSLMILGISWIYDIISALIRENVIWVEYFWYWNILQCIAMARILGIGINRLPKWLQICITGIVWVIGSWLALAIQPFEALQFSWQKVVYYIGFNPMHGDSLLIFFPFFMVGKWLGEEIFHVKHHLHEKTLQQRIPETEVVSKSDRMEGSSYRHFLRKWGILAVISLGIALGIGYQQSSFDYGWKLIFMMNRHPAINSSTLPLFLIPNSYAWVWYCLTVEIGLTLITVHFFDIAHKWRANHPLGLYGKFSLTIYIGQYLFLFLPWFQGRFTARSVWIPMILFIGFWGGLALILIKTRKTHYTIEYGIKVGAEGLYALFQRSWRK